MVNVEKKIDKYKGLIKVKPSCNKHVEALLLDKHAIERMVDFGMASACSGKDDAIVRTVMQNYVESMLKAAVI